MDPISLLEEVSKRDSVGGRIVMVLREAARLVGEDIDLLERELLSACRHAPGALNSVCEHILASGGKHVRPVLCLLSYRATGGTDELPLDMAATCELLHNATLLHDDVIDEGEARRGKPTARVVYGNALSVLGGDYLLIKTIETVSKRDPAFMPPYVWTLNQLVSGELIQLQRRGSVETSEADYFRIVEGKTASLFRWSVYSGALAAGADEETCDTIGQFGWHVGVAFQLMDDVLDFTAESSLLGKNLFADIQEGKMTLPVILAAQESPSLLMLLRQMISRDFDPVISRKIADAVLRSGVVDEVRQRAVAHTAEGLAALRSVSRADARTVRVIEELASALLERGF